MTPFQLASEIQAWLDQVNRIGNDLDTMTRETVAAVRSVRQQRLQQFLWEIPVQTVRDFHVRGAEHSV